MLATPTYEKEYSHEEGNLILKIWFPPAGEIWVVPTYSKGVGVPIAFPVGYLGQEGQGGTVYRSLYPYEIERYFCGWGWEEGIDFWEELKARELVQGTGR